MRESRGAGGRKQWRGRMSGRWAGVPRGVRLVVGALVAVFAYGTVVHVVQLVAGGGRPYGWAPGWLAVYFTALTLLDPLAALLLSLRRRAGWHLGLFVLVTDALANAYAVYGLPGGASGRVGQAVVSLLAVGALLATPYVHPWLSDLSGMKHGVVC